MENKKYAISLTENEWNAILNILSNRPFGEVANLINSIVEQAKSQIQPTEAHTE